MGGYAEFLLLDDLCLTSGATRYRVSYPALITVRWCRTTGSFHPALGPSYLNEKLSRSKNYLCHQNGAKIPFLMCDTSIFFLFIFASTDAVNFTISVDYWLEAALGLLLLEK